METPRPIYGTDRHRVHDLAIRRAGQPDGITVMSYIRRQTGFVVFALVIFVVTLVIGQPLMGAFLGALLIIWMRLWLHSTATNRQKVIDRELPDFLDVLGVTVAAGLSFRQAVERISEHHSGPMGDRKSVV